MASWVGKTVKHSNPPRHVEVVARPAGAMRQIALWPIPHCGKLTAAKLLHLLANFADLPYG
jgi:hypothetical protein